MEIKSKIRNLLKIDPRTMRKLRKIIAPIRRIGIKKKFTIYSNNCWGGRLYDKFSLKYLTPTIGLAFEPKDFVKFLENPDKYFNQKLIPIEIVQKKVNDEWGYYDCTCADIKILFRHYRNVDDAIEKWNRRKERIIKNNIIVKFTYFEDDIDKSLIDKFTNLPYKKLILFIKDENIYNEYKDKCLCVYFPNDTCKSEFITSDKFLKLKDIKKIINE